MQNKPNFRKAKMNVSYSNKMNYKKTNLALSEVEWANSNPNKPNFRKTQNEHKLNFNKELQKKRLFSRPKNKPNSNLALSAVEWANLVRHRRISERLK